MTAKQGGKDMIQEMTDKQFKTILEMVDMILDGCKDLAEAKEKVQKLIENQSNQNGAVLAAAPSL